MAYQQTLKNGTVLIEEFQILGHLGSGGFANTYLATDLTLGREVAVKEYFPSELAVRHESERVEVKSASHGAQFEWALGRFVREAKTLAKFRHPSVVRVFRVFNANDTAYIVLEFVRGSNMEAWLKGLGRQPTQGELDELLPPLLDALEVVHSAGILHRDIKPANIYIRAADHTPVLLDFGAARYAAGDYAGTTAAIVSKGYSPHEAYATDSRLQGPWTDIYGLAATIYRALSGSAPPESTMRVLEDHCVAAVDLDLPASGGYRREFLAAIDWALAVMPKQRPQSVADWRYKLLPNSTALPRLRDANGDPTTIQEWNPISDRQSDATTFDPPQKSDARASSSQPASGGAVVQRSGVPPASTQRPAHGGPRPSVIVGVSNSVSGTARPRSAGSVAAQGSTSGPASQQHPRPGVVSRPSQPVGNRTFMVGLALFAAGGVALLGQWLVTRKPSSPPAQLAAPIRPGTNDSRDAFIVDRNRIEREQAQRAASENARIERETEQKRLADESARQQRDAEQKRLADESARQQRDAEQKRLADESARQQRETEQKRLADESARQQREIEQKRLADESARQQREAEQKRLADESARQQREAEQRRLADESARQQREAEQRRLAEEKARQQREAEQRRLAEEKARQQREAEQKRVADEKARQQREAEQQRLADEKARKDGERQVAVNTTEFSTGGGSRSERNFPLTGSVGNDEGSRRTAYLRQIQTVLKSNRCYTGDVTGDPAATRSALEMFEKSYQGPMKKIDVASASSSDLESWLGWFWKQESWSCGGRPEVDRQADQRRREREADQARERQRERAAEEAREERRRERAAEEAREERRRARSAEEARERREREAEAARQARRRERDEPKKVRKVERPEPKQVYKAPAPAYRAPARSSGGGGGGGNDLLRGGR